jgi:hypothetical protein
MSPQTAQVPQPPKQSQIKENQNSQTRQNSNSLSKNAVWDMGQQECIWIQCHHHKTHNRLNIESSADCLLQHQKEIEHNEAILPSESSCFHLPCHSLEINSWRIKAGTENPMVTNYSSTLNPRTHLMMSICCRHSFIGTLFKVRVSWIKGIPVLQIWWLVESEDVFGDDR